MRHIIMTCVMLIYLFPLNTLNGAQKMKLPCEVAVKSVVPAIRALLAKELTETYGMKQKQAANLLGITQTAVSKYTHHVRGRVLIIEQEQEIEIQIKKTAAFLAEGRLNRTALALQICNTCKLIREKRLMCKLCKQANPTLNLEQCKLCFLSPCDSFTLARSKKSAKQKGTEQQTHYNSS